MNGELPKGWASSTIGDVADINPRHPKDLDDSLPVSFVPMPGLSESGSDFKFTEERRLRDVRKGYTHFAEGDVLFAKITPCMENGKAAVAAGLRNALGCGTTELHVLRPRLGVSSKYVYHYIHQQAFRREAAGNFTGTAGQLRVPVNFIRYAEIPLAPAEEQRRIVAALDALLPKVEDSRNRLEQIPGILKRFRQSVLAAACSGRLTEEWREMNQPGETHVGIVQAIRRRRDAEAKTPAASQKLKEIYDRKEEYGSDDLPPGWGFVALAKLSESFDYGTSAKSRPNGNMPVLRMGNIQDGKIDWEDLVYTSDSHEIKRYCLQPKTVLFNRTNSPELVGKTAIYRGERPTIFAGYLIRVNHCPELDPEYLNLCLNTNYAREFCQSVKTDGVSQSNINAQKLGTFEVPFCSLAEQQEIVRRVYAIFKVADRIEVRYQEAKKRVDGLTQSILGKAFRGELVPQDPDDEPAAVLLVRMAQHTSSGVRASASSSATA